VPSDAASLQEHANEQMGAEMANTGRSFEIEVCDYMEASLNAGDWGLIPKLVKVCHKAEYWSDMRESMIITDVSGEFYRPNETKFWLLWVIECKRPQHPGSR